MKRIYHTWDKWECYPAGFYENKPPGNMTPKDAVQSYAKFLMDTERFEAALDRVITEWKNSCEHYLSNECMNRIAWLGQAAACIDSGLPSCFRGGFNLLGQDEKRVANEAALLALNRWLVARGEPEVTLETAKSRLLVELY